MTSEYKRIPAIGLEQEKIVFRGCVLPACYVNFSQAIDDLEVRDDDVWVISHPKAGTTWTQEMVWCIGNNLDLKSALEHDLPERFPFLEHIMLLSGNQPKSGTVAPPYVSQSIEYITAMTSPRYIKTHLPWQLLPRQIRDGLKKPKMIYVARNAKDVCMSFYHHFILLHGYKGSCEDFCQLFLEDQIFFAPFWPHVVDFWKQRQQCNVLFITFEDMKKDLVSVIRQVSEFLDKSLTEDQTAILASHISFSSMKTNNAVNMTEKISRRRTGDGDFIRKGEVGGWKEEMNSEMVQQFDDVAQKYLQGTGLVLRDTL